MCGGLAEHLEGHGHERGRVEHVPESPLGHLYVHPRLQLFSHFILGSRSRLSQANGTLIPCLLFCPSAGAVEGRLPGQQNTRKDPGNVISNQVGTSSSGKLMFSIRPSSLSLQGFENPTEGCFSDPNGKCGPTTYAVSDVYVAEICVLSHICRNNEELFRMRVGEIFECEFEAAKFMGLRTLLRGD